MTYGVPSNLSKLKVAKRAFVKQNQFGVSRIVRDDYGGLSWYDLGKQVRQRDNGCCKYCGKQEDPSSKIWHDVHHIVPLSRGGLTKLSNLVLACDDCHQRKHPHHTIRQRKR